MDLTPLGTDPISPDNPAGEDIAYDPDFEALQAEIDKMSIASAEITGTDWDKVVTLCTGILAGKCKHLLVAVYCCVGLTRTRELDGFTRGSRMLADMLHNFWDDMFPPKRRMRGRLNALHWFMEKMEAFFLGYDPGPLPGPVVDTAKQALLDLDEAVSEASEDAPMIRRLSQYLDRLPREPEPEPETKPEPVPDPSPQQPPDQTPDQPPDQARSSPPQSAPEMAAPTTPRPSTPPASGTASVAAPGTTPDIPADADPSTEQGTEALIRFALKQLGIAGQAVMERDPSDPRPYLYNRMAAWNDIRTPPPSRDGRAEMICMDDTLPGQIEQLIKDGELAGALATAESQLATYPYWLELGRLSADALERMGEKGLAALDMVRMETLRFAERVPGLENISFANDVPFAGPKTKAWLEDAARAAAGGGGADPVTTEADNALSRARDLHGEQKTIEALDLLQQGLDKAAGGRARLVWRMALTRFLVHAERADLGTPMARTLLHLVDEMKLEEWDSGLALSALSAAFQALSLTDSETETEQAATVLARIAGLSPSRAVRLTG